VVLQKHTRQGLRRGSKRWRAAVGHGHARRLRRRLASRPRRGRFDELHPASETTRAAVGLRPHPHQLAALPSLRGDQRSDAHLHLSQCRDLVRLPVGFVVILAGVLGAVGGGQCKEDGARVHAMSRRGGRGEAVQRLLCQGSRVLTPMARSVMILIWNMCEDNVFG